MKLWAIGDLHLANRSNREALRELPAFPRDWLILVGDVGEKEEHLRFALSLLLPRFEKIFWVPGNHDLWTSRDSPTALRGEVLYRHLVEICRSFGVVTPEDPFLRWPVPSVSGRSYRLAPLFTLFDYTFRPPHISPEGAVPWAAESGVLCSDEILLAPDPYPDREAWCAERLRYSEERLTEAASQGDELILINHWPLREDLLFLRRIPRFSIWCGSKRTEDWHTRFPVATVVYGHLHIKGTHFRDGVRFEECSLGYPRDWRRERGIATYLRQILPEPETWLNRARSGVGSP